VVLHALYLIFNDGYAASSGTGQHRFDLTAAAIRLTRLLHHLLPGEGEVASSWH
jgi:predicted RNA polymerase sigma factor